MANSTASPSPCRYKSDSATTIILRSEEQKESMRLLFARDMKEVNDS